MRTVQSRTELAAALSGAARPLGLIPTMGALHAGHEALIRAARAECASVLLSIYVNPRQFTTASDLAAYPRTLEADAALAAAAGVDLLFAPTDAEIYPPSEEIRSVDPGPLAERLEGAARPGHFAGVATVVTRLFDLVGPEYAYFGEKDAQQLRVVEWIAAQRTSAPRISIRCVPTVRDADGLALSSRNAHLSAGGRSVALAIPRALDATQAAFTRGERNVGALRAAATAVLADQRGLTLEYLDLADPITLAALADESSVSEALVTIAAAVDGVRLIDERTLRA